MHLPRAPRLPDQNTRASTQADDQGDEEKHDGEHPGHGCQGLSAEHLADVDTVDRAGHGLEKIGEDHGGEEKQVGFPEGALGCSGIVHGLEVHLGGWCAD